MPLILVLLVACSGSRIGLSYPIGSAEGGANTAFCVARTKVDNRNSARTFLCVCARHQKDYPTGGFSGGYSKQQDQAYRVILCLLEVVPMS